MPGGGGYAVDGSWGQSCSNMPVEVGCISMPLGAVVRNMLSWQLVVECQCRQAFGGTPREAVCSRAPMGVVFAI